MMERPARAGNGTGAAIRQVRVDRHSDGPRPSRRALDVVAVEEPLEIRVETRSIAVLMRTPGHDEELAAGFLLSEGVIRRRADLAGIRPHPRSRSGNVVDVFLADGVAPDLTRLTRHVFASASCGLCGRVAIAEVRRRMGRVRERFSVSAPVLAGLPAKLREVQPGFSATGALHGAGLFTPDGGLLCAREDIGRHCAVDKVIGHLLLADRVPLSRTVLAVSGRVSFEIVQKALAGGVAVVVAVGAPSSLAVEFARASGLTLAGFVREGRVNVYAGGSRVTAGEGTGGAGRAATAGHRHLAREARGT